MVNFKYNPLLKLNLQEEADVNTNTTIHSASEFVSDCQKIQNDDIYPRIYQLTQDTNFGNFTCKFSVIFLLNGYTLTHNWAAYYNGKILYFFNGGVHFLRNGSAKKIYFDTVLINNEERFFIQPEFYYFFNCKFKNASVLTFSASINWGGKIFVYNQRPNVINNINYNTFEVAQNQYNSNLWTYKSDGTAQFGNTPQPAIYINVDTALDPTSRGLLPNSVITAALNNLQPDSTLDADSNKPVMNSAVTQEINTITQIIENFQDINVSTLQQFEDAIQTGQNANVRIHLTTDITLTQSVTYNLDKIQIYGHDNKINLQNFTFTIEGETAYFNAVRFNANSSVNATTAENYSNAQINIISTVNSARYFFEYVIFMNFVCKSSDNSATDYVRTFFDVQNGAGTSYPSLHLYFTFCEIMTNYTQSNINSLCAAINHSGSLHALTVHNIDFWGNNKEANSCPNWTFTGNSLSGLAKLGWISDGSAIYAQRSNSLTPSFVNQYNPSYQEYININNNINNIYNLHFLNYRDTVYYANNESYTYDVTVFYNSIFAFVNLSISTTGASPQVIIPIIQPDGINIPCKSTINNFYYNEDNELFNLKISPLNSDKCQISAPRGLPKLNSFTTEFFVRLIDAYD